MAASGPAWHLRCPFDGLRARAGCGTAIALSRRTLTNPGETRVTSIRLRFLVALLLLACATPLVAQDPATASLAGFVTDPAGAAVAGARVHAVAPRTGAAREATSGARGVYVLTSLDRKSVV